MRVWVFCKKQGPLLANVHGKKGKMAKFENFKSALLSYR